MRILPFFLDFSPRARSIRKIRPDMVDTNILHDVAHIMKADKSKMSVDDFQEIWARAERTIRGCTDDQMRDMLNEILRDARWEVQSWHRQYRYR
jgi:hypothetical protein